jgi:hypothetical protein
LAVVTVTSGFILRKLVSPMPRMFIRSSTFLNPPFFSRYSMIRSAMALPTPGIVSSWAALAVFRLTAAGPRRLGVRRRAAGLLRADRGRAEAEGQQDRCHHPNHVLPPLRTWQAPPAGGAGTCGATRDAGRASR